MPPQDARDLVLASSSPRRRELLRKAGVRFAVQIPDVDERRHPGEAPQRMAQRLAVDKARAVAPHVDARACVLASDTIVVIDGDVLGKPDDADHAAEMLRRIAGRTHTVYSGWAALVRETGALRAGVEASEVTLREVSQDEAHAYAASGEPLDKAGAYALQGDGGRFVRSVEGSRSNVIGLPLEAVLPVLRELGVAVPA